ncbi:hypothetical protein PspLS_09835 [Pyricularia sp. CBS 133598]|nr:hypothetical protein PspLS_09835 [Pyricularia sp. CBS 133598]
MRVSTWFKFTLLAALSPQALAEVLADHGADKARLVARCEPSHKIGQPHPDDGCQATYPPQVSAGLVVKPAPKDTITAPPPGTVHNKRSKETLTRFPGLRENDRDENGNELEWGEGMKISQVERANPYLPGIANREEVMKMREERRRREAIEKNAPSPRPSHQRLEQPSRFPHNRRSVLSDSAPRGRITARGYDRDSDSGKGGVDLDGEPIYKLDRGHRTHRTGRVFARSNPDAKKMGVDAEGNPISKDGKIHHPHRRVFARSNPDAKKMGVDEEGNPISKDRQNRHPRRDSKVSARDERPATLEARLVSKMPEDLQLGPPRPKPKPKKAKEGSSTEEKEEGDPRPRENPVYNEDGSFHKHAARRRGLEARNVPKYFDANVDPSSRDKGVHMDDGSIAPHGRRLRNGKSCKA